MSLRACSIAAAVVMAFTTCNSDPPVAADLSKPVALVLQTPPTVELGGTAQLQLRAINSSGNWVEAPPAAWTSDDPGVATVSATGLVTGVALGTALVTARAGALVATARLYIVPTINCNGVHAAPGTTACLTIWPPAQFGDEIVVAPGQSLILTVYGYVPTPTGPQRGAPRGRIRWTSSRPGIVALDDTGGVAVQSTWSVEVTGLSSGTVVITASDTSTSASRTIRVEETPGNVSLRFVHAAVGEPAMTLRPRPGPEVSLSFGDVREQTLSAGTVQLLTGTPPFGSFEPAEIQLQEFTAFLNAGTKGTIVVIANDWYTFLAHLNLVPLWDWQRPVPADSVRIRVLLATAGGNNVYLVPRGAGMATTFLEGCYLDWPFGFTDHAGRAAGVWDIVLQEGKGLNGPEAKRFTVTPTPGRATTYILVRAREGAYQMITIVEQ